MHRLLHFLSIRPNEEPLLRWFTALTFVLFFFLTIGYSAVDSLFMAYAGGKMIPYAWLVLGGLAVFVAPLFANLSATKSPSKLLLGIVVGGTALILGLWVAAGGTSGTKYLLFYAVKELYALFLLSFFWNFLNGFLDTQQAKRFLPVLGAVWSLGDFAGGKTTGLLARALGAEGLFPVWAAGTLALLPLVWIIDKKFSRPTPPARKAPRMRMGRVVGRVRGSRLLGGLAATAALYLASGIALRYQYYDIFGHAFPNVAEGAAFLGSLRAYVSLFKIAAGLFLLPRLVQWFGVRNVLLFYPAGVAVALVGLATVPSIATASAGFFVVIGMGQALYEPAFNFTMNVVAPSERTTLRTFFNGIMNPVGAIGVSLALLAIASLGLPGVVLGVFSVATGAALLRALWVVRGSYVTSVLQGLQAGTRLLLSGAEHGRMPRAWVDELEAKWAGAGADEKRVILEFLAGMQGEPPGFVLAQGPADGDPIVRAAFCRAAKGRWSLPAATTALLLCDLDARVRAEAARYAGAAAYDDVDTVGTLLQDPDPAVRAEAAVTLWRIGALDQVGAAVNYLNGALQGAADVQVPALDAFGRLGDPKYLRTLIAFAAHADARVRLAAAKAAAQMAGPAGARWLDALEAWLRRAHGEERHALIAAVARIGGERAARLLLGAAEDDRSADFFLLRDAVVGLGKPAVDPAEEALHDRARPLTARILALSVLNHLHAPDRKMLAALAEESIGHALRDYARAAALAGRADAGAQVLALLYREQADLARTFAIRALFAWNRYRGVRWVEQGIRAADRGVRANAAEALQNMAPTAMRPLLGRFLDGEIGAGDVAECLRDAAARPGRLWTEAAAAAAGASPAPQPV